MSNSRYYENPNTDEDIKPGKISKELRSALNVPENDVPIWIYRMRALGYPPGWLKKAVIDSDDIFDTDQDSSKRIQAPVEVQYDHTKLIEYGGFNTPMPEGCVDYHYYFNMPAMLEHQQLEYAKKHMNAFSSVSVPKLADADVPTVDLTDPASPDPEEAADEVADQSTSNLTNLTATTDANSTFNTTNNDSIKLVSKGSPMPKPVERASLESFAQGVVGELMYFENIPTSTGKFDSMRKLLNNIRKTKEENKE